MQHRREDHGVVMLLGAAFFFSLMSLLVGYAQIAFAAAWGALFLGEELTIWTVSGAGLITVAALVLWRTAPNAEIAAARRG